MLVYAGSVEVLDAEVYLHLRGWSRAPVTHLDVEAPGLEDRLVGGAGRGVGAWIACLVDGVSVEPRVLPWRLELRGDEVLASLRYMGGCRGYVGGKRGGVFIGMESRCLRVLEAVARERWGVGPRAAGRRGRRGPR